MKKLIFILLLLHIVSTAGLFAQLPNGTIAPNFTGTDLNGNTHTLYDLLNAGKTVIMDISATWCGPCWSYHQSNALEETWAQYGPNGTNDIVVLFVEGDPSTNLACLHGDVTNCNSSTKGDWVTGSEYPIIEDASIADLYEISYFPTIFAICPNKLVTLIGQQNPSQFFSFSQNCSSSHGENNGGVIKLESGANSDYFCGNTALKPRVNFQNLGTQNLTSAKFSLSLNGTQIQEKTWSGNLATYEISSLSFDPYNLNSTDIIELNVAITGINNTQDEYSTDDNASVLMVPNQNLIEENRIIMELRADSKPEQTRWEFKDGSGNILYSGGNPAAQPGANHQGLTGGYNPNQFIKDTFNLPAPDCYEFYIVDDRGNGLGEGGYFKFTTLSGETILEGGTFEDASSNWVQADNIPTAIPHENLAEQKDILSVSPNPISDRATIKWENLAFSPSKLLIYNSLGKIVFEKEVNGKNGNLQLQNDNFANGLYFVVLKGIDTEKIAKIAILK